MEVVITSLDALIQKATNASLERPDPPSVEAFCTILSDSPNGAYIATRVIASRMRSNHPSEALLALDVLDICMKRCDVSFRVEVDKFRFLNELIKLVSPKYYGNKTSPAVKQRVLNLMHSWTVEYPREQKIRDAFEMLKKQGVVKDLPTPQADPKEESHSTPKPKTNDGIFQDEEKARLLQKLLQSKNPDDIQAANRLIKTMVKEDERRMEAVSRRIMELQTVHNNARLLDEMLDQYKPGVSSAEDLDLIKELHAACVRLRPTVFKLAAETQRNEELLNDVLEASDELTQVFNKYTAIVSSDAQNKIEGSTARTSNESSNSNTLNGSSLLDLNASPSGSWQPDTAAEHSNIQVLGDIFSSQISSDVAASDILTPVSLTPRSSQESKVTTPQLANKGLSVLDDLGAELMKASCGTSTSKFGSNFNSKQPDKTPMNLLGKMQPTEATSIESQNKDNTPSNQTHSSNELDLDYLISKTLSRESQTGIKYSETHSTDDDFMVDLSVDDCSQKTKLKSIPDEIQEISLMEYLRDMKNENQIKKQSLDEVNKNESVTSIETNAPVSVSVENSIKDQTNSTNHKPYEIKPLTDINISLDNITPGDKPPVIAFEEKDGLSVTLHFTKNKPRSDVSVIVLSTTSKNKLPIQDFKFHAVVPKGCKVRLLPPSGENFPAFSPFLPPAAVTQVMLVAHPPDVKVFLKFVITYTCEDDSISEMGEISELPLYI